MKNKLSAILLLLLVFVSLNPNQYDFKKNIIDLVIANYKLNNPQISKKEQLSFRKSLIMSNIVEAEVEYKNNILFSSCSIFNDDKTKYFSIGILGFVIVIKNEITKQDFTYVATNAAKINNVLSDNEIEKGLKLISTSDCLTCHKIYEKNIGPSYYDISKKYELNDENIIEISHKIITGGGGKWGKIPMTPHPNLSESDAKYMVKYILSIKK